MSQKRDCYEILSIERSATADEIKSAYRKSALKWHPDRNPQKKQEAEEKFREATEAYSILSDPQKRSAYDRFGYQGISRGGFDGGVNQTIFDEEGASGVNTKIRLPRLEFCESCNGTGAKAGTGVSACSACGGRGQVHYQQGFFTISRTCPECRGAGQIVRESCPDCKGQGRIERAKTIDLRIPPGVDSNTRLRVPGEGDPGENGGPPGDLYVVLEVKSHPYLSAAMPTCIARCRFRSCKPRLALKFAYKD